MYVQKNSTAASGKFCSRRVIGCCASERESICKCPGFFFYFTVSSRMTFLLLVKCASEESVFQQTHEFDNMEKCTVFQCCELYFCLLTTATGTTCDSSSYTRVCACLRLKIMHICDPYTHFSWKQIENLRHTYANAFDEALLAVVRSISFNWKWQRKCDDDNGGNVRLYIDIAMSV